MCVCVCVCICVFVYVALCILNDVAAMLPCVAYVFFTLLSLLAFHFSLLNPEIPILFYSPQLNERLAPYRAKHPGAPFADIAKAAYFDRADLSAHGFYKVIDVVIDFFSPISLLLFVYFCKLEIIVLFFLVILTCFILIVLTSHSSTPQIDPRYWL